MSTSSTFLRFTTRGLLSVMLGLSVGLAIAFSLLPPLLGITRGQMAMMLGLYSPGFLIILVPIGLLRFKVERRAGECLLALPLISPKQVGTKRIGFMHVIGSCMCVYFAYTNVAENDTSDAIPHLAIAGTMGAWALFWLGFGRAMNQIELRQCGIIRMARFSPWDQTRTRTAMSPESPEPSIEFYFASKWHRPELTPADREVVEAILVKYKPLYAELGHV